MNTKTFFEFYDLEDTEVLAIQSKGENLSLILNAHLEMKFIANGCRSEFDNYFCHEFLFLHVPGHLSLTAPIRIKDYAYDSQGLHFKANQTDICIPDTDILIHKNVQLS